MTLPIAQSPLDQAALWNFNNLRPSILDDAVERAENELSGSSMDVLLGEALYSERVRLKRNKTNIFTRGRASRDRALWSKVQAGLLKPSAEVDRRNLLNQVLRHYAEEIGGHFNPEIYKFTTHAVPFGFSWLLNAASIRQFVPWNLKESVQSRLNITGEVDALRRLAEKGTILMVPTHQSNIDSIMIGYVIHLMSLPPFAYGAGLNLFSNPVLSFFMNNLGAYTVDRQKTNVIYKHVLKDYSTRILHEGVHSIFFPGGGRSRSGAIESRLKLGLLGTALDAQLQNHLKGSPKPNVYVVPMVTSYHFVLEAGSLIEDYLAESGKHHFIITDDESWQFQKVLSFFWKFFRSQSKVNVRIGRPLDIFGNFVDEEGRSLGPNGTTIDPKRWLTTHGELRAEPQRDRQYTLELGNRIVERFHRENTVLTSHLVAWAFFETLRKQYPDLDLYRFLRLSLPQRSLPYQNFMIEAERWHAIVRKAADQGAFNLTNELKYADTAKWVSDGVQQLGLLHDAAVVKIQEGAIWTEDMNLLYYYRNRLTGFGLNGVKGQDDQKGFLA